VLESGRLGERCDPVAGGDRGVDRLVPPAGLDKPDHISFLELNRPDGQPQRVEDLPGGQVGGGVYFAQVPHGLPCPIK
jgi:hypothetical protein